MKYECSLDSSIKRCTRNALIGAFHQLHGNYVPSHVHPCLQWNAADPYEFTKSTDTIDWKIVKPSDIPDTATQQSQQTQDRFIPINWQETT